MSRAGQQGYVLFTVVVMLFVVAVTAYLVTYDSSFKANQPAGELEAAQADYVAEAAMQHALWQNGNNACVGDFSIPATALGQDSYTASSTGGGATSTVTLFVDQDSFIKSQFADQNNGADTNLHVQFEPGIIEQAVYRFDLSPLAAGARINSAVAWFYLRPAKEHPEGPITLHRVTTDWTENDVTWNTISGKFENSPVAMIPAQEVGDVWVQVNLTAQVQAWVNGAENYGILFRTQADGVHAEYSAKEDAGHPPRLEVTVGTTAVSSLSIEAIGTLAGGLTRTLNRTNVATYQPPSRFVSQTGSAQNDTYTSSSSQSSNFGSDIALEIGDAGSASYTLIDFNLAPIPMGARIVSAELSLNLESYTAAPAGAMITAHRMLEPWTENGASYNKSDGTTNWDWPDNHDTSSVVIASPFESPPPGRITLDLRPVFADWAGHVGPNFGIALAGVNGVNGARFTSSDGADESLHPRLTMTVACDCGTACLLPQSSGAVLLAVDDDIALTPHERTIRAAIESWGYTVTLIWGAAPQVQFDAQAVSHDVIFVADTAMEAAKTKLANMTIGVVSMQGSVNTELGLADGWAASTGSTLNIIDSTHYITQPYYGGSVEIFRANMAGISATGGEAPDLQTLGDWNGAGGLVVLDKGAQSTAGTVAGRRVLLPLGHNAGSGFDWNFLKQDGRLLVQRSIEWAADSGGATGATSPYFLSTDSSATLGGLSFTAKDIVEYEPLTDTAILHFDGNLTTLGKEIDALHVLANGHLLLSSTGDTDLGGVSMQDADLVVYDIATDTATMVFDGSDLFSSANEKVMSVHVLDNGHFILSTDSNASLGGLNFRDEDLVEYDRATDTATMFFDGSLVGFNMEIASVHVLANGHIVLTPKTETTLAGVNVKAGDLIEYDPVADTAELIFVGDAVFADSGEKLMSIHIGPGTGIVGCVGTFRDEFNAKTFDGSDGTLRWTGDWLEIGESNGADAGDIRVRPGLNDFSLRTRDNNNGGEGVEREANLYGAATATLSYEYRRAGLDDASDYTSVEVSANGAGGPWTELTRYQGPGNDGSYQAANHDISTFISDNTRIRFKTGPDMGNNDRVLFDNIQISCAP